VLHTSYVLSYRTDNVRSKYFVPLQRSPELSAARESSAQLSLSVVSRINFTCFCHRSPESRKTHPASFCAPFWIFHPRQSACVTRAACLFCNPGQRFLTRLHQKYFRDFPRGWNRTWHRIFEKLCEDI